MSWTLSDIAALERAVATGVRKASFGSGETRREQEFHSLADMLKLLDQMRAEVLGTGSLASRRMVAGYCSGL